MPKDETAGGVRLYLNGVLIQVEGDPETPDTRLDTLGGDIGVGSRLGSQPDSGFNWSIADFQVYSHALTTKQI